MKLLEIGAFETTFKPKAFRRKSEGFLVLRVQPAGI
jgi:hypothetical protein